MALAQGMRETRGALAEWRGNPRPVLRSWFLGGFGFAAALLTRRARRRLSRDPDPTYLFIPGVNFDADVGDYFAVIWRNGLVLALHAVACVAGFIAGSSLPLQAQHMTGFRKMIHERARPLAFAWVVCVITFSLVTQAYILGSTGSTAGRSARPLARDPGPHRRPARAHRADRCLPAACGVDDREPQGRVGEPPCRDLRHGRRRDPDAGRRGRLGDACLADPPEERLARACLRHAA